MYNSLQNRISIEIEGNIPIEDFEAFYNSLKKRLNIIFCGYFTNYLEKHYDIEFKYYYLNNFFEKNILKDEYTIKAEGYLPTEFLIQKYDIFKKDTLKVIKKACKIYDKYQTRVDPYEAIHVNFDARSFFPYIKEIYDRNFELFDLNKKYRRKIDDSIITYSGKDKIKVHKKNSIDISYIDKQGRVEFRIFNSDKNGRKKLIKFLKNTKRTVKEGYRDFDLMCYDELDKVNFLPGVRFPKTTNNLLKTTEKFENVEEFMRDHKKGESFVVNEFFSMRYEDYDKLL